MDEIGADTFCERCGTRYSFSPTAPQTTIEKARFFARGFKHFVMNDGSSVDEAIQAARIEGGETVKAAEQFQNTFNFCMICRQYACEKCWNENQNACLSCAPLWDKPAVEPDDRLLNRTRAAHPGHGGRSGKAARGRAGIEWPTEDVEVARTRATAEPMPAPTAADELIPPRPVAADLIPPRPVAADLIPPRPVAADLIPPRPSAEDLITPPRPAHATRLRSTERRVEEPAPFPFADEPVGLPPAANPSQPGRSLPAGAPPARPEQSGSRTPSWVAAQDQAAIDEMREKSQEWMARDDDWALWTSDEAPSRPAKPAAEMAAPPAPPQAPARAPRQSRSEQADRTERHAAPEPAAPEAQPYEAPGLDQLAATRPASRDERIGGRSRTRQPEPAPAFEPPAAGKSDDDLIPPPASTRSRAGHSRNVSPPLGNRETPAAGEVGFDLIGSLRQPVAPAGEPSATPKARRTRESGERHEPVVGRILGGHRPPDGDVDQPKRAPEPKAARSGSSASSKRTKDRQPSEPTRWPTPTRWEERPVADEELADFDRPVDAELPPAPPIFDAPLQRAAPADEAFRTPPAMTGSWVPIGPEMRREIESPPEPRRPEWPAAADAAHDPAVSTPPPGVPWPRPALTPEPAPTPVQWPPVTEIWPPLPTEEEAPPAPSASMASRQALEDGESPLVAELWAESARQVLDLGNARVCHGCSLPLSTHARFCRRCGASQD